MMKTNGLIFRSLFVILLIIFVAGKSYSQGFFSTDTYTQEHKGVGAASLYGWGENFSTNIDLRPNISSTIGSMILNYHTGLTFSAHSNYGGIRFYNQGYPNPYDITTGAKMVMSITGGNVGIGTSNPNNPLTIGNGNPTAAGSTLALINTANSNTNALVLSNWYGGQTDYGPRILFDNSTKGGWYMGGADGSNNLDITRNWGTPDLRITSTGNIGIGTGRPFARLHIKTDVNTGVIALGNDDYPGLIYASSSSGEFRIDNRASQVGYISFYPNGEGQSPGAEAMRINSSGNIGIGTVTPDAKLAVNGTLHSKEVKVDLNNWPDYVFKKDYLLMPLSEVKAYVDLHQHLPEIPSEMEIVTKGLHLGEMNKLLMQKVEELTLYLLEKDKQIKEQETMNLSSEQRIKKLEEQVELLIKKAKD